MAFAVIDRVSSQPSCIFTKYSLKPFLPKKKEGYGYHKEGNFFYNTSKFSDIIQPVTDISRSPVYHL